jgi:flagellar export protein FliJ
MAKRNVLERLWRLRELEEEQSRLELGARVAERNRIAQNLAEVSANAATSRGEFVVRMGDPDTAARTGALVELEQARRRQTVIRPRLDHAETEVELRRGEFLTRRTGRRQVETLLDREREAARAETARRAQQMLDDWYGRRGPLRTPSEQAGKVKPA